MFHFDEHTRNVEMISREKKFLFHLDLDKLYFDDVTILTSYYYSGIHECISLELQ